ncbi:MAG: hypothetical protein DDT26_01401 [Dehalococcoidia bacterium]|nr:hypothetical protein [Chloroflexota bacterium]
MLDDRLKLADVAIRHASALVDQRDDALLEYRRALDQAEALALARMRENEALGNRCALQERAIVDIEGRLDAKQVVVEGLRHELVDLRTSMSWKVTVPLRWVQDLFAGRRP